MSTDKLATNLNEAWRNFDPDLPLAGDSPFFVDYERDPLERFTRALLRSRDNPMRLFLAGFRGSGKSTHLNRMALNPKLVESFFIVKFSIKDTCDFNDISIADLLLGIATSIVTSLPGEVASAPPMKDTLEELRVWGNRVEERVREANRESVGEIQAGAEAKGGIPLIVSLFTKLTASVKLEEVNRKVIRDTIQPQLSDLQAKINLVAAGIRVATGRPLLVIVDDTDKLQENFTSAIFNAGLANLTSLNFHALYTVREFVFFSPNYPDIKSGRPNADILRNVKLYSLDQRDQPLPEGEEVLLKFMYQRMSKDLIEKDAAKQAAHFSGGVFRQLATLMQIAVDHAIEGSNRRVEVADVTYAANELRKGLLLILTSTYRRALQQVYNQHTVPDDKDMGNESIAPLFLNLAILLYVNEDTWYDINPVLWKDFREPVKP